MIFTEEQLKRIMASAKARESRGSAMETIAVGPSFYLACDCRVEHRRMLDADGNPWRWTEP